MKLHIDIETYSETSIKAGVYKYVADPAFEVLLFAYQYDDGPVKVVDLAQGDQLPRMVLADLVDPGVTKYAHNAPFEVVALRAWTGILLDWSQWRCTMVMAAYLGLPLKLEHVAKVLHLTEQKDTKGKALIKYFTEPVKTPKAKDGFRTRNLPHHAPEKWAAFVEYNAQDVRTEVEVEKWCDQFPGLPANEWAYWVMDQEINDRGVAIDVELVEAANEANGAFLEGVHAEMRQLTGIDNPNSLTQLKAWFVHQGVEVKSLNKEALEDLGADGSLPGNVARLVELRRLGSKASVSKYDAMLLYRGEGDRIRGLFQFYGANRTGREAGRGVQLQNLKRTPSKGIEVAREAVRKGLADLLYDDVPELISKLVRTALVAPPGRTFAVSDFAAIEARVIAWLAGEEWVLDVFKSHGKIYEATAARMFSIPIEKITKGSPMRQKGKVASLALGYQGASGALITMGALREGLTEEELPAIVHKWRQANPNVVKFWRKLEAAARMVVERRTRYTLTLPYTSIGFSFERGHLFITLPSGRRLAYYGATVRSGKLEYWGLDQIRKVWCRQNTYGGKLAENVTQAIARDCLFDSMDRMAYLAIVMHVHDEIVAECNEAEGPEVLAGMEKIMAVSPVWANGLPLKGDGFVTPFYKKD